MTENFIIDYLEMLGYQEPWITYVSDMTRTEIHVEFLYGPEDRKIKCEESINLWDIVAKMHN